MVFRAAVRCLFLACASCLAPPCVTSAHAQDLAQAPSTGYTVKVATAKKHGEVQYRFFYRVQKELLASQAPEPRLLDFWYRADYADMSESERETYQPEGWAVSVVSASVDQDVPVRRGGYFRLPDLPLAYEEDAVVLFRETNRRRKLLLAWEMRIGPDRKTTYASLLKAAEELRGVQKRTSVFRPGLWRFKLWAVNAVQACFKEAGGAILVAGQPVADETTGSCKTIKIDPNRFAGDVQVEFAGSLEAVLLEHL